MSLSLHPGYTYSSAGGPARGANRPHERRRGMLKLRHAQSSWRAALAIAGTAALFVLRAAQAPQSPPPSRLPPPQDDPPAKPNVTHGRAEKGEEGLIPPAHPK